MYHSNRNDHHSDLMMMQNTGEVLINMNLQSDLYNKCAENKNLNFQLMLKDVWFRNLSVEQSDLTTRRKGQIYHWTDSFCLNDCKPLNKSICSMIYEFSVTVFFELIECDDVLCLCWTVSYVAKHIKLICIQRSPDVSFKSNWENNNNLHLNRIMM